VAGELEPFDVEAELAWLVQPASPPPTAVELARQAVRVGLPVVVDAIVRLAVSGESERTRLDAAQYVLRLAAQLGVLDGGVGDVDALLRQLGDPGAAA
jgi:hypothetical protein